MGKGRAIIGSCPRAKGKGGEADHEKRDKRRASFVALVRQTTAEAGMDKGLGCESRTVTAAVYAEAPDRWRKSVTGATWEGRSGAVGNSPDA